MANNVLAPHALRGYVWQLLSHNTGLTTIAGKDNVPLVPIIPINDEPDLSDSGKTYIIYGFVENEPVMSVHRIGTISFRVMARTFAELGEIVSVLSTAFEIEDEAAGFVNRWTSTQSAFLGIRFTSICTTYIEAGTPETMEGGPIEGVVNLRYRYVREGTPLVWV